MSDALLSRQNFEGIRVDQSGTVESLKESVRLAKMRYNQGFSSYFEVLEAQQLLFPAELALAPLVIIQLYKALGGGWNLTDEQFRTARVP